MKGGGTFLIFIAVIGLVVGGLVLATPQNNSSTTTPAAQETVVISNDPSLVNRADAPRIGPENAKVKIIIFSDYLCPYCKNLHDDLNKILADNSQTVSLTVRTFIIHEQSEIMSKAAEAANRQGKFKEMNDELFLLNNEAAEPDEASMTELAKKIGLDADKFKTDIGSAQIKDAINRDNSNAQQLNLQGTPSAYINGTYIEDVGQIDALIKEALNK
jgi:protein-disulfide isomerase